MALSAQQAPGRNLVIFKSIAKARGCRVIESLPETSVNVSAHAKGSWHRLTFWYKGKRHSKAADINFGPAGASSAERAVLLKLIPIAESLGLGVIFAKNGTYLAAKSHQDHLHVDLGSWSNLGSRATTGPAKKGDAVVYDTQVILHFGTKGRDNLNGNNTERRLDAIAAASNRHGNKFPRGIKFLQRCVGAKVTGKWDRQTRRAHDKTVRALAKLWKDEGLYTGRVSSTWSAGMDAALARYKKRY